MTTSLPKRAVKLTGDGVGGTGLGVGSPLLNGAGVGSGVGGFVGNGVG